MIQDKKKLLEQLAILKIFPNNVLVKDLRKQIEIKLKKLEKKEQKIELKQNIKQKTNQSRSSKLRKYHNYIRQIRNNYPEFSYSQIRTQLLKRKQGKEVSIPDVIWQNPSP